MKKIMAILGLFLALGSMAQTVGNDSWKKIYRETPVKINDLVHTKLDASFDYSKSYLNGKVWLTLKPHF